MIFNRANNSALGLWLIVAATLAAASPAFGGDEFRISDEWWARAATFQSEHYDVRTDLVRADAEDLARHMDRMFEHYSRILSGMESRKDYKLHLLLFRSNRDYLAVLDARYDAEPKGTGGMAVRDRSRLVLAAWKENNSVDRVKRVLQHEGFHQFAASLFPNMPSWADEGLAEVCEAAVVMDDQVVFGEVDGGRVSLLRRAAAANRLIPIETLFKIDSDDWLDHVNAGEGSLQYAQAWALVHLLLYGDGGRYERKFNRFLATMNEGQSWESAFHRAFDLRDYDALQQRLGQYIQELQPTDFRETMRRLDFLTAGLAVLHESGTNPTTIEALAAALQELGFSHPSTLFGQTRLMKASDASIFLVPLQPPGSEEVVFELFDSAARDRSGRPARDSKSARRSTDKTSDPDQQAGPKGTPSVGTRGLKPFDLAAIWEPAPDGGKPGWRITYR